MKVKLLDIGVIKEAEIDLCKKFILFCGPNSTGKTYVAYVIYGLTKLLMVGVELFKLQDLIEKKELNIELDYQKLFNLRKEYLKYINQNISAEFASKPEFFTSFKFILVTKFEEFKNDLKKSSILFDYEIATISIRIEKQVDSDTIKISLLKPIAFNNPTTFETYLLAVLSKYLINKTLLDSFMLAVERNSVFTFSKELSLKRLKKNDDSKNIEEATELQERMARYPHAIRDSLAVAEDLANIIRRETKFKELAENIERDILHGKILVSDQGELQFSSSNNSEVILPVHLSASLIKTISGLIIYLKHQATSNDLIIIDEPELNLHPDNQILLTRIFAKLINNGFRILISTHSDYIIREINNLIMLYSDKAEVKKLAEQFGYQEDHKLNPKDIGAYLFNFNYQNNTKVVVENLQVLDNGFEVKTIDEAINKLNDVSEELFYALKSTDNE